MSDRLSQAIVFAANYHAGQEDKGGEPYILHPLRVMMKMETEDEKIVAVLHDVLEDTEATEEEILEHFGYPVVNAVIALTRREEETYADYIDSLGANLLARKVKLVDIQDNLDPNRKLPEAYASLRSRYRKALLTLSQADEAWPAS
jgi:(p)ppGpp synthase/HD superfamily hydrolase